MASALHTVPNAITTRLVGFMLCSCVCDPIECLPTCLLPCVRARNPSHHLTSILLLIDDRVESFIEHQDSCSATRTFGEPATPRPSSLSWTTSSTSPSTEPTLSGRTTSTAAAAAAAASSLPLALHVLPTSTSSPDSDEAQATVLQLSIGPPVGGFPSSNAGADPREQLLQASREKALASDARQQALKQVEMAEKELANAKTIRRQAQAELENAYLLRDHTAKQINLMLLQITCHSCRKQLQSKPGTVWEAGPKAAASYAPSAMAESKEDDSNDGSHFRVSPNTQLSP